MKRAITAMIAKLAIPFAVAACCLFVKNHEVQGLPSSSTLPSKCGLRILPEKTKTPNHRIVGGYNARYWPWEVRIVAIGDKGKPYHRCGGALINNWWFITAGHCITNFKSADEALIVLGDYDITKNEGTEQYFNATDLRIFENYSAPMVWSNDFGMVKLDRPVKYSDKIQPICLPAANSRIKSGSMCYMTGWGAHDIFLTQGKTTPSAILQEAKVPTVSHQVCDKAYSAAYLKFRGQNRTIIHENSMLCTGYGKASNISGCYGDSGGPLNCEEGGRFVLRGATSGGPGCNTTDTDTYTIYARVSSFVDWVKTQLITSAPTYPRCKDSHWFCKGYEKHRPYDSNITYCTHPTERGFVRRRCPITCKVPECFPQTKNETTINARTETPTDA